MRCAVAADAGSVEIHDRSAGHVDPAAAVGGDVSREYAIDERHRAMDIDTGSNTCSGVADDLAVHQRRTRTVEIDRTPLVALKQAVSKGHSNASEHVDGSMRATAIDQHEVLNLGRG